MAQDYYDPLQVFDALVGMLDDNKATLGLGYIAKLDEELLPQYPAVLVTMEAPIRRTWHSTGMFNVEFNVDFWVFHALLSVGKATRSRLDIELATQVRKLIHQHYTLSGHIIDSHVTGEYPGRTTRIVGGKASSIVTTRLTWEGRNRVPREAS